MINRSVDKKPVSKKLMAQRRKFASDLALMKFRAGEIGLFYTMQKMEAVVQMVGFELAGTPEAAAKSKL
jgi:hypothetical protein